MTGVLRQISRSNGGLPKLAVEEAVFLSARGIEGDSQRNLKYHGGPDKAVLVIAAEVVNRLAARGYPVIFGSLGENLTVSGFDPHDWRSGQKFGIGADAALQLTTLRTPCLHLNIYGADIKAELYDAACRDGHPVSRYWAYGGFYARVISEGIIRVGDAVRYKLP